MDNKKEREAKPQGRSDSLMAGHSGQAEVVAKKKSRVQAALPPAVEAVAEEVEEEQPQKMEAVVSGEESELHERMIWAGRRMRERKRRVRLLHRVKGLQMPR